MATAMKKVEKIRQIVRLKQLVMRWKITSLRPRIPAGFLAVYVGLERIRYVIPARFVNLPLFVGLLKKTEEEFGFECSGGLVLPCEVEFFREILKFLERDESRFGRLGLDEFLKMVSEAGYESCKNSSHQAFTPLLQKVRG